MSTEEKKPEGKKGLSAKDQEILTDSPFIKRAHEFCAETSRNYDADKECMILIACDAKGQMVSNVTGKNIQLITSLASVLRNQESPLYKLVVRAMQLNELADIIKK